MTHDPVIFVIDDDMTLLDSMRWLLESLKLSVQTYPSARAFLASYDVAQPGCLVLDVRMPEISGLQLQEVLHNRGLYIPVLIITGHANVSTAVRAMKAGALDLLEKPFNDQDLLECVQHALAVDARRRQEEDLQRIASARLAALTSRENEVLERVVHGQLNKVIAAELGISMKTVEAHRSKAMEKLGVRTPLELASVYFNAGGYRGHPPESHSSAESAVRGLAVNI